MRTIRRTDREIPAQEAAALLERAEYGVLSTVGADGQPYGLPLSYVYRNGGIYFHCALSGHKLDNFAHDARVSFCAVGATRVLPDKFATEYESAVAFGVVSELEGDARQEALLWLLEKYSPAFLEEGKRYIEQKEQATKVFKIEVSHYTGKARR
jgi:uncharacterized protein